MNLLPQALKRSTKSALSRWFAKRAPKNDNATLNLRNIYIFFSREGLLFAVLLLITFITGINYGNNLVLGLCFYLISIWLISFHITFAHISGLQVRLLEVTMAEAGAPVYVTLQLKSESRQPRRQLALSFEQSSDQVVLARLQDEQIIRLAINTEQRGELELPRLQIKTVYPLGIMRAWSYIYFARSAWVYPKPLAFDWQEQYLAAKSEELPVGKLYGAGQDDFERLDNYIVGESLSRVSWGHVARGQGMFTKHFADPIGHELRLDYADMPALQHEQKLAQLTFGVMTLGQLRSPFYLQLNHDDPSKSTIGQGEVFAQECLLRLAKSS